MRFVEFSIAFRQVAQPSAILVRASLEVCLHADEAVNTLKSMVSEVSRLHFRFPGSSLLPSLSDLRSPEAPKLSVPSGCEVAVEVFAEDLGSSGCSNFLDLNSQEPTTHRVDFAAYVLKDAPVVKMAEALIDAATYQLNELVAIAQNARNIEDSSLSVRCYAPEDLGHAVCLRGTEDLLVRQELHRLFRLSRAPLLVPDAALPLPGQAKRPPVLIYDCFKIHREGLFGGAHLVFFFRNSGTRFGQFQKLEAPKKIRK